MQGVSAYVGGVVQGGCFAGEAFGMQGCGTVVRFWVFLVVEVAREVRLD